MSAKPAPAKPRKTTAATGDNQVIYRGRCNSTASQETIEPERSQQLTNLPNNPVSISIHIPDRSASVLSAKSKSASSASSAIRRHSNTRTSNNSHSATIVENVHPIIDRQTSSAIESHNRSS